MRNERERERKKKPTHFIWSIFNIIDGSEKPFSYSAIWRNKLICAWFNHFVPTGKPVSTCQHIQPSLLNILPVLTLPHPRWLICSSNAAECLGELFMIHILKWVTSQWSFPCSSLWSLFKMDDFWTNKNFHTQSSMRICTLGSLEKPDQTRWTHCRRVYGAPVFESFSNTAPFIFQRPDMNNAQKPVRRNLMMPFW